MIFHYSLSPPSRAKTFKYLVKACDECIHRKAYSDIPKYANKAKENALSKTELNVLYQVLHGGIAEMSARNKHTSIFNSHGSGRVDNNAGLLKDITEIANKIEKQMEDMNKKPDEEVDIQTALAAAVALADVAGAGSPGGGALSSDPSAKVDAHASNRGKSIVGSDEHNHRGKSIASFEEHSHRGKSIQVQKQKERQLDWAEDLHNVDKSAQLIAEEKEAKAMSNRCVIS